MENKMPRGVYVRKKPPSNKGVNKYGIKLEDFDNYKDYYKVLSKICNQHYRSSEKGLLNNRENKYKYYHSGKGKLIKQKYRQGIGKENINYHSAKRRSAKLKRTVPWADLKAIREFYTNCPKGYHVDHIIPLQGTNVSGLHVLNNLQYLTKSQNSSKGNKWI